MVQLQFHEYGRYIHGNNTQKILLMGINTSTF